MEAKYEQHFTAFVDLLGFSEIAKEENDSRRLEVLSFLRALASLRGEFNLESTPTESGFSRFVKPAISTFSDHIVISLPLRSLAEDAAITKASVPFTVMGLFAGLLAHIAAAALSLGLLLRGGATIGNLYHADGVVFGEALIEAFEIESRTSVYPRVVLSQNITGRKDWIEAPHAIRDFDGLYHVDYFSRMLFHYGPTELSPREWLDRALETISTSMKRLEGDGRLKDFAKWRWFAGRFRSSLESFQPGVLKALGITANLTVLPK